MVVRFYFFKSQPWKNVNDAQASSFGRNYSESNLDFVDNGKRLIN